MKYALLMMFTGTLKNMFYVYSISLYPITLSSVKNVKMYAVDIMSIFLQNVKN